MLKGMPSTILVSSKRDSVPVSTCQWTKMILDEQTERQEDKKTESQKDWLTDGLPDHLTIWPPDWINKTDKMIVDVRCYIHLRWSCFICLIHLWIKLFITWKLESLIHVSVSEKFGWTGRWRSTPQTPQPFPLLVAAAFSLFPTLWVLWTFLAFVITLE